MTNSYRNVTKLRTPGSSSEHTKVVNIYQNGTFKLAYSYRDWTGTAVSQEVQLLEMRFPSNKGWTIDWK